MNDLRPTCSWRSCPICCGQYFARSRRCRLLTHVPGRGGSRRRCRARRPCPGCEWTERTDLDRRCSHGARWITFLSSNCAAPRCTEGSPGWDRVRTAASPLPTSEPPRVRAMNTASARARPKSAPGPVHSDRNSAAELCRRHSAPVGCDCRTRDVRTLQSSPATGSTGESAELGVLKQIGLPMRELGSISAGIEAQFMTNLGMAAQRSSTASVPTMGTGDFGEAPALSKSSHQRRPWRGEGLHCSNE